MNSQAEVRGYQAPSGYLAARDQAVTATNQAVNTEGVKEETDKLFGPGLGILQLYMRMLSQQAGGYHREMSRSGARANEAQNMVSKVDAAYAEIDMSGDNGKKVAIIETLWKYLKANLAFAKGTGFNEGTTEYWWSKKDLKIIQGNIQKYATQNTDAVSQSQLQVQKIMQTYNVTVGLMNSLQTLMGDMNKMFAQATR